METKRTTDIWSMMSAFFGTALIITTVIVVGLQLQRIQGQAERVYQSGVLIELELDGLETEILALESVVRVSEASDGEVEAAGIQYSQSEIEQLKKEVVNYRDMIKAKRETLQSIDLGKKSLLMDLLILFWASLLALLVGIIAAVLGYLSWFHKLRIFRDRRQGPRLDDLDVFEEEGSQV